MEVLRERHVWAEIDLAAYDHNLRELRRVTRPEARLMAVVKADGYGHGAIEVSRAAVAGGADWLGVARPAEAVALRQTGIDLPIMIFGRTPAARVAELATHELTQAVFALEMAQELSQAAKTAGVRIRIHVKVDTGMGRLGLPLDADSEGPVRDGGSTGESRHRAAGAVGGSRTENAIRDILAIARLPGLDLEGLFTHFASADRTDLQHARRQLERFLDLDRRLRTEGLEIPLRHAANSAALIGLPESHLEMVRSGIATYGLYPSAEVDRTRVELRPVMTLKSRIIQLRELPAGTPISYGGTYRLPQSTRVATVGIGYADGFSRLLSNRGRMLVRGHSAPIVGRVCMDLTMVDVGEVPGVSQGDEVVAFGGALSADEIADLTGTINYEVVSTVMARVLRVYH